ncbi:MAG: sulfatase [Thermoanaerobaculales bacterium]|nr:sulfatase [Thermoanaerobaculales bacterium]
MRVPIDRLLLAFAAVASIAACGLSVGCAREPREVGFEELLGRFVADPGIYVFPDRSWRREGVAGGSFRRSANLLVLLEADTPQTLRITYVPTADTEGLHFVASWDDTALWDGPRAAEDSPLRVDVPAERLSPGLHRLRLERVPDRDRPELRGVARCFFDRVTVERVAGGEASPVFITANQFAGRFVDFGVTSNNSEQLSGCLFSGPRAHRIQIAGAAERSASFLVLNQSSQPARFAAAVDGAEIGSLEVPARMRLPFSFPVPPGRRTVTLSVEGIESGFYLWGAPHLRPRASEGRTPVFLISLDTTRRDAVSPYSGRPEVTPTLAALARVSDAYTNAFAVAPWTLPSHASIFTGLYPSQHRAGVSEDVLALSHVTLAELFRRAGYRTAGFAGGSMTSSRFGLAQGFDVFLDPRKAEEPGDVIADAAIDFVEEHSEDPIFVFLNFFDPHGRYDAPVEFQQRLAAPALAEEIHHLPVWGAYARNEPAAWTTVVSGEAPASEAGLAYMRARYDAEVAFMDHQIGRFLATLRERSLFDKALIVVVADHGEFMGERGLFSHSYRLDPELTWVPLLIKWPNETGRRTVDDLVSQVDLFPAILAAAGLQAPSSEGIGFGPGTAARLQSRNHVFMEEHKSRFHQLPGPFWIADHLAGLQYPGAREVLYAGQVDCSERRADRWVEVECGSGWEALLRQLPDWLQVSMATEVEVSAADLDEAEIEQLKALGYLQ